MGKDLEEGGRVGKHAEEDAHVLLDLDAFDIHVHTEDRHSALDVGDDGAVSDAFYDFDDAPTVARFPHRQSHTNKNKNTNKNTRFDDVCHIAVYMNVSVCLCLCVCVCVNSDVASVRTSDGQAHNHAVMLGEMLRQCQQLDPEGDEQQQCEICTSLEHLLRQDGQLKHALMHHHQVMPLLEMLDSKKFSIIYKALRVVHEAITERQREEGRHATGDYTGVIGIIGPLVDNMLTVGLAHRLLATCSLPLQDDDGMLLPIVQQAALVLNSLCWAGEARHVQMLVACQAIPVLVDLLSAEPPLNHVALDCISKIMDLPTPTPKTDLCHLLARCSATERLVVLLQRSFDESRKRAQTSGNWDSAAAGWVDLSEQHAHSVASILLFFSRADKLSKADMCRQKALLGMLSVLEPGHFGLSRMLCTAYVKLLKALRHLSGDTAALEPLEEAGAVGKLVRLVAHKDVAAQEGGSARKSAWQGSNVASEVESQAMLALYNLCKLSKARQEQAAAHGIVPCLKRLIVVKSNHGHHPLRQLAIPLLCDLAHAGTLARHHLLAHDGLTFYLRLLSVKYWNHVAHNSIASWVTSATDVSQLEEVLLSPDSIQQLNRCLGGADRALASNLLPPLIRILQLKRLNRALGESEMVMQVLKRLHHPEAVVRKGVLQVIQMLYEHAPDARAFIVKHELHGILERVVQEDESKLVQEQARVLLRAIMVLSCI